MANKFTGGGLVFPIEIGPDGRPAIYGGPVLINASINHILSWPIRNKYFNEDFGSRLEELLEEPDDAILKTLLRHFIKEALSTWEKRIDVDNIKIINKEPGKIQVEISYQIKKTKEEETFIYPFYRQIIY